MMESFFIIIGLLIIVVVSIMMFKSFNILKMTASTQTSYSEIGLFINQIFYNYSNIKKIVQNWAYDKYGVNNIDCLKIHSFPRIGKTMNMNIDLSSIIIELAINEKEKIVKDAKRVIDVPMRDYKIADGGEPQESLSMHGVIFDIEQKYGFFNFSPMTIDRVKRMIEMEGIDIVKTSEKDTTSWLAVYSYKKQTRGLICIRENLFEFQELFLYLHELGHWFLHAHNSYNEEDDIKIYRRVRNEQRATIFALLAIFPSPTLYWIDRYKLAENKLTLHELRNELIRELYDYQRLKYGLDIKIIKESPDLNRKQKNKLIENIDNNVQIRVDAYLRYSEYHLNPIFCGFPDDPDNNCTIDEDKLLEFKHVYNHLPWINSDINRRIVDYNDEFTDMYELTNDIHKEDLKTIIHEDSYNHFEEQWKIRLQGKNGKFVIRHKVDNGKDCRISWVIAWPVVKSNEVKGAFAVCVPRSKLKGMS
jgi:Zn-dependent peptidase ImmA (M78 family)